jgi:hypothetical protein
MAGTEAGMPTAATELTGLLYEATDTSILYRCTGSAWIVADMDYQMALNGGAATWDNCDRRMATADAGGLVTQIMRMSAIMLPKGIVVTNITCRSGATPAGTPTNWWFALYKPDLTLLAQTADQLTAAWAATTTMTKALTGGPFTLTVGGLYYAAVMVKATTVPTLVASIGTAQQTGAGLIAAQKPTYASNGSGLTTTAPAGPLTLTGQGSGPYVVIS